MPLSNTPAPHLRPASTPGSPPVPRFALTEPGSRVCAAGWDCSGSMAGSGVPPGDTAMAHSCSACSRAPRVLSYAGRAAPGPSGRGEGRAGGVRPWPPATRRKSGSCEVHGFVGQVSPWGPFSLRRVLEGMRTRGGLR